MKKLVPLFLAALFILQPLIPAAQAAEQRTDGLTDSIHEQYLSYAHSKYQPNADDAVVDLYWYHALHGGDLDLDEDSSMACVILNSATFEEAFTQTVSAALTSQSSLTKDKVVLRSLPLCWYDHKRGYRFFEVADHENDDDEDDTWLGPLQSQFVSVSDHNENDDVLALVGGSVECRITLEKRNMTPDEITYDVSIQVYDLFEYDGDYSQDKANGLDTSKADLLTFLGKLMGLDEFSWSVRMGFSLTVPNPCLHASTNYRWEFDGRDLVSVSSAESVDNPLSRKMGTTQNGVFSQTSYTPSRPIRLVHDRPWSLELTCKGSGFFYLASLNSLSSGGVYLRKAANTLFFGEAVYLNETDETYTVGHYGVWFTGVSGKPVSSGDEHTYRLTNRIFGDGSNMVYLSIDGQDFGPMNQYYLSGTSQHTTVDWVSGRDFEFSYVGSGSYPINNLSISSLQVWENGIGAPSSVSVFAPTGQQNTYTCQLCGCSYRESSVSQGGLTATARRSGSVTAVTLSHPLEALQLVAAGYDSSGALVDTRFVDVSGTQARFQMNGEQVKLFFLEKSCLKPLLPALSV